MNHPPKKLHKPHHKIPTVNWKHWGKKQSASRVVGIERVAECINAPQSSLAPDAVNTPALIGMKTRTEKC